MQRKNRGNGALDLTSLLDVVFIILFIIVMAYAQAAESMRKAAEEQRISNLEMNAAKNAYEEAVNNYAELEKKVLLITLYSTYSDLDETQRSLKIISTEKEINYQLNPGNESTTYTQFEEDLTNIIENNSNRIVFISLNTEKILRKDTQRIMLIVNQIKTKHENLY